MAIDNIFQEYAKCLTDIGYYGESYCEVFDQTQQSRVPLKVFVKQKELLRHFQRNKNSIVLKPRQAGVSTVTALFAAHQILFSTEDNPKKILIVANKLATANEFIKKIRNYIDSRPDWLNVHYGDTNNKSEFELVDSDGKFIGGAKATATSEDAMRGYTPTLLIMDEAAFIDNGAELWASAGASLSTGGGAIFISTPNGMDELYYSTYEAALKGDSNFKIFEMQWWQDPRFNKDMVFEKTINNIKTTTIARKDIDGLWDVPHIKELIADGFVPTSGWFKEMCLTLKHDKRKIAQELLCDFLGSGDSVFEEEDISKQKLNNLLPLEKGFFDKNLHIWEYPIEGAQYLLASDVSRGDSADYSSIEIFNMDTGNQAAEWVGKVPPDKLAELIFEIGIKYLAMAIVDITGGMGQATVLKLLELEYPWIYYCDASKNNVIKSQMQPYKRSDDQIPGFIIGGNRTLAIQALELAFRNQSIIIRSERLLNEFKTFVWLNGKPDHQRGKHDDMLIAVAMIVFVFQHSFKSLQKYNAQTLAMLNGWLLDTTTRPSLNSSPVDHTGNLSTDDISWYL